MLHRNPLFSSCLIGAGLMLCGSAHAADDAAAICNAAISATGPAAPPVAMSAQTMRGGLPAPDGRACLTRRIPWPDSGRSKFYASFMKPGERDVFTDRRRTHDRRLAL